MASEELQKEFEEATTASVDLEDKKLLEVGNEVEILATADENQGMTGIIIQVDKDDDDLPYLVEFTEETGEEWNDWYAKDQVRLVTANNETEPNN